LAEDAPPHMDTPAANLGVLLDSWLVARSRIAASTSNALARKQSYPGRWWPGLSYLCLHHSLAGL